MSFAARKKSLIMKSSGSTSALMNLSQERPSMLQTNRSLVFESK
jgi:hypothetical protein